MLKNILFAVRQLLLLNVHTILQQLSNKTISFSVSALKTPFKTKKPNHFNRFTSNWFDSGSKRATGTARSHGSLCACAA